jgi:hypothetical protein
MRLFQSLGVLLVSMMCASAALAFGVECTGYDSTTGAIVQGQCNQNFFEGYDTTGAMVEGSCSPGAPFTAYNNETGALVSGSCEAN